jgi:hypothetical protein
VRAEERERDKETARENEGRVAGEREIQNKREI